VELAEKQRRLVEELLLIDDAQERLAFIADRAKSRPPLPEALRREEHRVRGCVSAAWVVPELRGGRCHFAGDADSPLVRGLVLLLCDFYSDAAPSEIATIEPALVEELGLTRMLSPTRLNGLRSVRAAIRDFAARQAQSAGP
jgi:cysteine desulfuration protein SufE